MDPTLAPSLQDTLIAYLELLAIACAVGIVAKRFAHVPYTIALTLVGLAIAAFRLGPDIHSIGFEKETIFFLLLPPLLFQGAFHMQLNRLRRLLPSVLALATLGVVASTLLIGAIVHWTGVFDSLKIAMLFGALICTTDPVSVLAIFRQADVPADLKYLIEGESLFNDGTGVVIFLIVLASVTSGEPFQLGHALVEFVKVSIGGVALGAGVGLAAWLVLRRLHDHLLENAICLIACYGSFCLAEKFHLSGVISTVCAGLALGNYGRTLAMSEKTIQTVETFFESIDFLINSLLFIFIGLELQDISGAELREHAGGIAIAIAAVLAARAATVYPIFAATRRMTGGQPMKWAHVVYWGGLRGSIPIALLLGIWKMEELGANGKPLLVIGFSVVCFSLIVQGLTMKPLIAMLKLKEPEAEGAPDPAHHQEGLP